MKVALVHYWLVGMRGGEKVLAELCAIFPEAPIFTLFHFPGSVSPAIESHPIHTSFLQRRYIVMGNVDDWLLLNVVLMGTDRTSIHKPQFCLKGMGWDIDDTESAGDTLRMTRPYPYDLPVMKLLTTRQVPVGGKFVTQRGVYVYWFVADNDLTGDHWVRMRNSATHLLRTGELQRWAYVTCFAVCLPGDEKATYERIYKFLSASVPEFQLTAGPHLAAQNATQTASEKASTLPDGLRN